MYQGDENDIVIVSLVRSNKSGKIGFLSQLNRRCVAQSRARCGMYFIGNSDTLTSNAHWRSLILNMNEQLCYGDEITLQCSRHQCSKLTVGNCSGMNFCKPFCTEICNSVMHCKQHLCTALCQTLHDHDNCEQSVTFRFPNCGHAGERKCNKKQDSVLCKSPCLKMMSCGKHRCKRKCSESDHHHHDRCEEICVRQLNCGHLSSTMCYEKVDTKACEECRKRKSDVIKRQALLLEKLSYKSGFM